MKKVKAINIWGWREYDITNIIAPTSVNKYSSYCITKFTGYTKNFVTSKIFLK
jgi:hypothetical protein